MIARERLIEIAVAVGGVAVMFALLFFVGDSYGTSTDGQRALSSTGGELVVYSIVAFVVVMAVAGLVLLRTVTVVESEADDGDAADA